MDRTEGSLPAGKKCATYPPFKAKTPYCLNHLGQLGAVHFTKYQFL